MSLANISVAQLQWAVDQLVGTCANLSDPVDQSLERLQDFADQE